MKKVFLGLAFSFTLVLAACSTGNVEKEKINDLKEKYETTESSLKDEISKLESENSELKTRVENFEGLFEGMPNSESESNNAKNNEGNVKLGESLTFTSYEKVTVNEVLADDSIDLHDKKEGEHPVKVTAVVENTSDSPISFNAQSFSLYDGNDELANFDASTYSNNIPHEIAGGKKATIIMHFSSKGNAPYSVTYGPGTWSE